MHNKLINNSEKLYCNTSFVAHDSNDTDKNENENTSRLFPEHNSFVKKRGLKILHQNINGLRNKMENLKYIFYTDQQKYSHHGSYRDTR